MMKALLHPNSIFRNADKKKITYSSGLTESEIDYCKFEKVDRKFFLRCQCDFMGVTAYCSGS